MKVLVFDTETTGLPKTLGFNKYYSYKESEYYKNSRIVSICWKVYEDGNLISNHYYLIRPIDFKIDNNSYACKINKITQEDAFSNGIIIEDMYNKLEVDLKIIDKIVAHNLLFDKHILLAEFYNSRRNDLIKLFESKEMFCTMNYSKNILKIPMKNGLYKPPKLIELYNYLFQSDFEGAHNAEADVDACANCYFQLLKINK